MTIQIDKENIDGLITTYLSANNMIFVDVNEPTHELCEYFATNNQPALIFDGGCKKLIIYTHHAEVAEVYRDVYDIDIYVRR